MTLISIMFTAFGTAVATRLKDFQGFQLIMNFLVMPLFFLSGALFPIEGLPPVMKGIVNANPLGYGVDAMRHLLIGVRPLQSRRSTSRCCSFARRYFSRSGPCSSAKLEA